MNPSDRSSTVLRATLCLAFLLISVQPLFAIAKVKPEEKPKAQPTPRPKPKPKPVVKKPEPPKPAPTPSENVMRKYTGSVGKYSVVFNFRIDPASRVTGSYVMPADPGMILRLEGDNPEGEIILREYTREKLTANIRLKRVLSPTRISWEGTMYNTPPDNRVFPVSISRPR